MTHILRPAFVALVGFSLLTGVAYPLLVTGFSQLLFPAQADGSLIQRNGQVIGSTLIAQNFTSPRYFWPRPSAAGDGYDASNSGASNLGPDSKKLLDQVTQRAQVLRRANPDASGPVPESLVTASASGLDPEIPPGAALWQVPRVAKARGLSLAAVTALVNQFTQTRTFGLLGEPRVNVLKLNLALDALTPAAAGDVESGKS